MSSRRNRWEEGSVRQMAEAWKDDPLKSLVKSVSNTKERGNDRVGELS